MNTVDDRPVAFFRISFGLAMMIYIAGRCTDEHHHPKSPSLHNYYQRIPSEVIYWSNNFPWYSASYLYWEFHSPLMLICATGITFTFGIISTASCVAFGFLQFVSLLDNPGFYNNHEYMYSSLALLLACCGDINLLQSYLGRYALYCFQFKDNPRQSVSMSNFSRNSINAGILTEQRMLWLSLILAVCGLGFLMGQNAVHGIPGNIGVLGMLVLWVSQILLMGKHKQTLLSYARKCEVLNDTSLDRQSHRIVSRAEPCDHSLPEEPDLNNAGARGEGGAKTADRSPTAHIPNLDCSVEGGDVRTGGTAKTSTETTTTAPAAAAAAAAAADTAVDVAVFAMEEVTWGPCESDPYSNWAKRKAINEEAIHAEAKKSNQPAAKSSSDETESLASSKSACLVSWKLRLLRLYIVAIYFFAGMAKTDLDWLSGATVRQLIRGWASPAFLRAHPGIAEVLLADPPNLPLARSIRKKFDSSTSSSSRPNGSSHASKGSHTAQPSLVKRLVDGFEGAKAYLGDAWAELSASQVIAYGGVVFDLSVGFALLSPWPAVRVAATVAAVAFHVTNHYLFVLETFPWVMISSCVLFHDPVWMDYAVTAMVETIGYLQTLIANGVQQLHLWLLALWPSAVALLRCLLGFVLKLKRAVLVIVVTTVATIFIIVHFIVPIPCAIHSPGDAGGLTWGSTCQFFRWRMMTRSLAAYSVMLRLQNPATGAVDQYYLSEVGLDDSLLAAAHHAAHYEDVLLDIVHDVKSRAVAIGANVSSLSSSSSSSSSSQSSSSSSSSSSSLSSSSSSSSTSSSSSSSSSSASSSSSSVSAAAAARSKSSSLKSAPPHSSSAIDSPVPPLIFADVWVEINGPPIQRYVDPRVDLAAEPRRTFSVMPRWLAPWLHSQFSPASLGDVDTFADDSSAINTASSAKESQCASMHQPLNGKSTLAASAAHVEAQEESSQKGCEVAAADIDTHSIWTMVVKTMQTLLCKLSTIGDAVFTVVDAVEWVISRPQPLAPWVRPRITAFRTFAWQRRFLALEKAVRAGTLLAQEEQERQFLATSQYQHCDEYAHRYENSAYMNNICADPARIQDPLQVCRVEASAGGDCPSATNSGTGRHIDIGPDTEEPPARRDRDSFTEAGKSEDSPSTYRFETEEVLTVLFVADELPTEDASHTGSAGLPELAASSSFRFSELTDLVLLQGHTEILQPVHDEDGNAVTGAAVWQPVEAGQCVKAMGPIAWRPVRPARCKGIDDSSQQVEEKADEAHQANRAGGSLPSSLPQSKGPAALWMMVLYDRSASSSDEHGYETPEEDKEEELPHRGSHSEDKIKVGAIQAGKRPTQDIREQNEPPLEMQGVQAGADDEGGTRASSSRRSRRNAYREYEERRAHQLLHLERLMSFEMLGAGESPGLISAPQGCLKTLSAEWELEKGRFSCF